MEPISRKHVRSPTRSVAFGLALIALSTTNGFAQECPPPPAPVIDIVSNRFYSDKKNSIVDPVLWEQRKAAIKPLEDFRGDITRYSSRGLAGNRHWSACTGTWLAAWAQGGALLGRMNETQANFERKWTLSAFSIAYLMVKPELPVEQRKLIEPWLDKVAVEVAKDYASRKRNFNNHYYWLGFALGASATATGHAQHWVLAEETYKSALTHIAPDGSLPKEVARGLMALHYHAFSIQPLVMLAELAALRGEDWYALEKGALHRLVAITRRGFDDPTEMAGLAGADQKPLERNHASWLQFYGRRFPGRASEQPYLTGNDIWFAMTGGNMSLLARKWVAR